MSIRLLLYYAFYYFFEVINIAILVYCIGSWFVRPGGKLLYYWMKLGYILQPLFYPAKSLLKLVGLDRMGIDFSPWLTCILLNLVYKLVILVLF